MRGFDLRIPHARNIAVGTLVFPGASSDALCPSCKEATMSKTSIVTAGLLLTLGTAAAVAGPCTDEVSRLTQQMAARDAGSGPTAGTTAQGTTGSTTGQAGTQAQHPPTATMSRETEGRATSPQDVQRQTMGQPTAGEQAQQGGTQEQHPPTATMSRELEGRAASPQDVQRQTMGQPPAAQQGQQAGRDTAGQQSAALDALSRARTLDQQGNESGCMNAVEEAKRLQR
jgi:hypothetical protein